VIEITAVIEIKWGRFRKSMTQQHSLPLKHWGLDRWPFPSSPAINQFYPTAGHNEALARIEYLVNSRRRLGALMGESGAGKSLVLRVAAGQLGRQGRAVALVDALGTTTREVLWQTACGLGTAPREDADTLWLWRQIADRLQENRMRQVDTVVLVDNAGNAGPDLVTQFVRLSRLDMMPAARWTMVLGAEPGQTVRWGATLCDLVDLRIEVGPWSAEDTIGYVQMELVEAGRTEPLFDNSALATLHELSRGVPRQVARLAIYALLAGAAAGAGAIDSSIVDAAYEETAWPAVAGAY
jgi:type II secretory pathway predicted ATPase ExeA